MTVIATVNPPKPAAPSGGSFLTESISAERVFTSEDFTEAQRQVVATTDRFMKEEILPRVADFENQMPGLARSLIEMSAELGLLGVLVPERYDGLEMDVTTQMLVSECVGPYASFSTTYGAHSGIGTLPIVFFGTEAQKSKYLPRLVTAEMLAAYCLSEPQAGSDSLASLTRAELTPDGEHYVLNGQKMWISNGGWADLYTVFAKVDGEKFTAFLVERSWDGVKPGVEEHKMGLRGSSTTALYLDNVHVPVGNVLGEIGRGHVIAFNVLNLGRLELAAACVGANKDLISEAASYATVRKAFGRPIGEFGAIRQKLADMAVRAFAGEAIVYRTSGMIDARLRDFSWDAPEAAKTALRAVEEYAIECSMAKVYLSEATDFIADEAVQVHGGYGYHQDYAVERGYRDSRINRIFEGTNEINRLLTTAMLLKRAAKGRLDLQGAIMRASGPGSAGPESSDIQGFARFRDIVARARRATLASAGLAYRRFGNGLEREQEVCAALGDMCMGVYAAESALLRGQRLRGTGKEGIVAAILSVLTQQTMGSIRELGELVLGACCARAELRSEFKAFDGLIRTVPADLPAARDRIAAAVLEKGGMV